MTLIVCLCKAICKGSEHMCSRLPRLVRHLLLSERIRQRDYEASCVARWIYQWFARRMGSEVSYTLYFVYVDGQCVEESVMLI